MTDVWVKRNGMVFKIRSPLDWEEAMAVANKHFGSPRLIGGPVPVVEDVSRSVGKTTGPRGK
jgi:hypothetical protein